MGTSHAVGRASVEHPTPLQLKELFSQIAEGGVTKDRLQAFLRKKPEPILQPEPRPEPIHYLMVRHGFWPADYNGVAVNVSRDYEFSAHDILGFLRSVADNRKFVFGKFRRPFVARLTTSQQEGIWVLGVYGIENGLEFQEFSKELESIYEKKVKVELQRNKEDTETFQNEVQPL
jgi:hypothetical protein